MNLSAEAEELKIAITTDVAFSILEKSLAKVADGCALINEQIITPSHVVLQCGFSIICDLSTGYSSVYPMHQARLAARMAVTITEETSEFAHVEEAATDPDYILKLLAQFLIDSCNNSTSSYENE